jgi:DNA topoisomerase-1
MTDMAKARAKTSKPAKAGAGGTASVEAETAPRPKAPARVRNLVIVESPAKAKTINRYLGRDYVVRASMGHVRDLPTKSIGVDLQNRFQPSYEPLAGRKKTLAELRKYAVSAGQVFLATDLDREGEAIAWHLAESLGVPEDRIRRVIFNEITKTAIQEAFAHPRSIDMNKVNAQQARRILDRIVGYQISPLLWRKVASGLSAGRVQTVAVRLVVEREREIEAFMPQEYWRLAGIFTPRCDAAPALSQELTNFLASLDQKGNPPTREATQEFYTKHQAFEADLVEWNGQKFRTDSADQAIEIAKALGLVITEVRRTEDPQAKGPARNRVTVVGSVWPAGTVSPELRPPEFLVRGLTRRQTRSRPPAPFTTASLQQAASVQMRFSASRTMRIAQQLYEGVDVPGEGSVGLITYMRTDSTHLAGEAIGQVRSLIAQQFGEAYVPEKPNVYASAGRAQEAHEAIRPTDVRRRPQDLISAVTDEQYKLYEMIWKRFVACQRPPAVWDVTEVDIVAKAPVPPGAPGDQAATGQAVFKAIGRRLAFDGFLRVAGIPRGGEQMLPHLEQNQPVAPVRIEPTQHFTQPPPRFTEASLVKALEADGIGRPSTYANIIQTIMDRAYVEQIDRALHPTNLGKLVTDKLVKHFPKEFDVRFTAHMEDQLDKVEEAHFDWVRVLEEFYEPFSKSLKAAAEEMVSARAETQPSEYVCEACGRPMVYRFNKGERYLACTGYPECKTTHPVDKDGRKVVRKVVDTPCPVCGKPMVLRRSRFGLFLGCSDYPDCKGTLRCDSEGLPAKMVKPEDVHETCTECGAPMAVRFKFRRAFLGCSRYPQCKHATKLPDGVYVEPPPKIPPKQTGVNCPKCGKAMVIRTGKRGEFLACSGFPKCRNAMSLDKLDQLKAQQDDKKAKE